MKTILLFRKIFSKVNSMLRYLVSFLDIIECFKLVKKNFYNVKLKFN